MMTRAVVVAVIMALASRAGAQPSSLRATDAWARSCRVGTTCGVYISLENRGKVALDIVGAASPSAAIVELHETMLHNGQAHMMAHATTTIPAGGRLEGKPGKWHVMLKQVRGPLVVGDTVVVTLAIRATGTTGRTTPLLVRAPVRAP